MPQSPVNSSDSRTKAALWPSIPDPDSTRRMARQASWVAGFVSGVTAVLAILAILATSIAGVEGTALIEAAVFLGIAWGIRRMSRTAAIAAFVLFVAGRILMRLETERAGGSLVALFVSLAFLNAVRATLAYYRFKSLEVPAVASGVTEPW